MKAFKFIFTLLVLFSASFHAAAEKADPYFPLEKGNFWIYRGKTKWTQQNKETGKNDVRNATLTWRMEVLDTMDRGYVFAAKIKGAPYDLSWYEPGKERGDYLIVRVGTAHYHLFSGTEVEKVWKKIERSTQPASKAQNLARGPGSSRLVSGHGPIIASFISHRVSVSLVISTSTMARFPRRMWS